MKCLYTNYFICKSKGASENVQHSLAFSLRRLHLPRNKTGLPLACPSSSLYIAVSYTSLYLFSRCLTKFGGVIVASVTLQKYRYLQFLPLL